MDANFNYQEEEFLERCITGKCTPDELNAFQARVENDPEFAELVALTRKTYRAIDSATYAARIRNTAQAVQRELGDEGKGNVRAIYWLGGLAAACAGFILFLTFAPLSLPLNLEEMNVVRNLNREYEQDSTNAFSLEKKRAFNLFFEAQSFLLDGETSAAVLKLEELSRYQGLRPYFVEAIKWHLVIGYIENGNKARAKEVYETLDGSSDYDLGIIERWKIWWHLQLPS